MTKQELILKITNIINFDDEEYTDGGIIDLIFKLINNERKNNIK